VKKLKAALFDFDGTLVRSIDVLVDLFEECLIEQSIKPIDRKEIRQLIGEPLDKIFQKLTNLVDVSHFSKNFRAKERAKHNARYIPLVEGTIPTLEFLKSQNLKLGIVSTKQRELIEPFSVELGIEKFFDVVIGGNDVKKPKPDPEPILLACKRLKVEPHETIFVGDSLLDLAAAKKSGVIFIGVLTGTTTREVFEKKQADYIFDNINKMTSLLERA